MKISEIREYIKEYSGNNAEFYDKLNPTAKPAAGIRIPQLRILAKKIAKDDYRSFLDENPLDTFEMEMLQGMVLGYAKDDIDILLKYLEQIIPIVHDWAVNDSLCQTFKIARKYPKETWECLMKYKDSKKEYEVRVVAVMLMSHFLTDEYIDQVLDVFNTLYTKEYYAQMGVAWAIATAMAKYPEKTYHYMISKENKLDSVTYKKSLQKMKESYRVENAMVEKILTNREI